MIITRTPFRVSFCGGGTDRRPYYLREPGQVISATINKFVYVSVRRQLGLAKYRYHIRASTVEYQHNLHRISNPIIKAALQKYDIDFPVSIWTDSDVPAYTGLGSSSAFAVGLIHALRALLHLPVSKRELAEEAAKLEVDELCRPCGKQDHYASAFGGLNLYTFHADESVTVSPAPIRPLLWDALQDRLMLFYTDVQRDAAQALGEQPVDENRKTLRKMAKQVGELTHLLLTKNDLSEFPRILREGWELKKTLGKNVSLPQIDKWYVKALEAGASGGKLLGAGGGGFLLLFVEPKKQGDVIAALPKLYQVPFKFETQGSVVIYRGEWS